MSHVVSIGNGYTYTSFLDEQCVKKLVKGDRLLLDRFVVLLVLGNKRQVDFQNVKDFALFCLIYAWCCCEIVCMYV